MVCIARELSGRAESIDLGRGGAEPTRRPALRLGLRWRGPPEARPGPGLSAALRISCSIHHFEDGLAADSAAPFSCSPLRLNDG